MTKETELQEEIKELKKKAYSGKEEDLQHDTYRHIISHKESELKGIQEGKQQTILEVLKIIKVYIEEGTDARLTKVLEIIYRDIEEMKGK